jgi:hypothetical protein
VVLQSGWVGRNKLVKEWVWLGRRLMKVDILAILAADALTYFVIKGLADWSVLLLTETKGEWLPGALMSTRGGGARLVHSAVVAKHLPARWSHA